MDKSEEPDRISVEVVFALPNEQILLPLTVRKGSTVAQVLELSQLYERFPAEGLRDCDIGIWGIVTDRKAQVSDGDRIELYRPLALDPRDARRLRADLMRSNRS